MDAERSTPHMQRNSIMGRLHDKCRLGLPHRLVAIALFILAGWILTQSDLGVQIGWFLTYAAAVLASLCMSNAWLFWIFAGIVLAWSALRVIEDARPGLADVSGFAFLTRLLAVANRQIGHLEAELVWIIAVLISTDRLMLQLGFLAAALFLSEPLLDYLGFVLKSCIQSCTSDAGPKERLSQLWRWLVYPITRRGSSPAPFAREERYVIFWTRRPFISIGALGGCHFLLLVSLTAGNGIRVALGVAFALFGALFALASLAPRIRSRLKIGALVASAACTVNVFAISPEQRWAALAFTLAVTVSAYGRLAKWLFADHPGAWSRRRATVPADGSAGTLKEKLEPMKEALNGTRWLDGPIMIAAPIVVFSAIIAFESRAHAADEVRRDEDLYACGRANEAPEGGAAERVRVFLVADTQLHNLAGQRFPGQMEVANALVPVARRPVELDILAEGTLRHFAGQFRSLKARWPETTWAYLGDFTDLACTSELRRITDVLNGFGPGALAGIAPGNHDNAFTGNFEWSPYWENACRVDDRPIDAHLGKALSDELLLAAFGRPLARDGGIVEVARCRGGRSKALAGYHRLGALGDGAARVEIYGVFLDTSDKLDSDHGVAGSIGTLSVAQADALLADPGLAKVRARPDVRFVVFTHHPIDELGENAEGQLERIVAALNGAGHRVVGFVSGHTHRAAMRHDVCLGGHSYDDAIIGSTTDAPQEAALLEIRMGAPGEISAEVVTLPAVARDGETCEGPPAYAGTPTAQECADLMVKLEADPRCAPLFQRQDGRPFSSCAALGQGATLARKILTVEGLDTPEQIKGADAIRAANLERCLGRDEGLPPPEGDAALRSETYSPILARASGTGGREAEAVCLGWAASVEQEYKASGMEFADALRCAFLRGGRHAFDRGKIQAAKRMPLVLRVRSCL